MTGRTLSRLGIPAVLIVFALFGCGDNEAMQRKAFIEFLQSRIVAKPEIHLPKLTADETAAFGDYAKHYAVIADFNTGLDREVSKPLHQAVAAGVARTSPRSSAGWRRSTPRSTGNWRLPTPPTRH